MNLSVWEVYFYKQSKKFRMMNRIKISLLLIALTVSQLTFAQKAEDIQGIAKEAKTEGYYKTQSELWKNKTVESPKDAHAWHMYYKAKRAYYQLSDYDMWLANRNDIFAKLKPIIVDSKKTIDGSYEYYLLESMNTDSDKSIDFTMKAYEIDPNRTETYESLLVEYVITDNVQKATEISKRMLACNYYSNALYKWNYNALQTVEKDGVFITQGDNDSMPRWILQYGKGIRKDVTVVNMWILNRSKEYRERIFAKLGVPTLVKKKSDAIPEVDFVNSIMIHVLKTSKKPAYVGCGLDVKIFKEAGISDKMFLVGTAFTYSDSKIDNLAMLKKNFEYNYELEYLMNEFQVHSEDEHVKKQVNLTYIPGIMKLKQHYSLAGDEQKCAYYSGLFERIAQESGREEQINAWYK